MHQSIIDNNFQMSNSIINNKNMNYNKKIGNLIKDFKIKIDIINYLYNKLDISKYRYILLKSIDKLEYLKNNEHYISYNFKLCNHLLLFITINKIKYMVLINRKNLSYHKNQIDINKFSINIAVFG